MNIQFFFDDKHIRESVLECVDFIEEIKSSSMFFYFPFDSKLDEGFENEDPFKSDINRKDVALRIQKFLEEYNRNAQDVIKKLSAFCTKNNFDSVCNIVGVLTPYGTYGYYLLPNTVYVNTSQGDSTFMVETFWHEVLHLIFENNRDRIKYQLSEELIDNTFIELLGNFFPNYYKQNSE